jgi:phosphoribosylformylglycinamidine synthase
LQTLFAEEGVEATAIGQFTGDGRLRVRYEGEVVAELRCAFLHDGMPPRVLESVWATPARLEPAAIAPGADPGRLLERALADPNVASKESIVRRYDHEVQGRTVGKPFVGPDDLGPADAAVLRPVARSWRGVAIGCGINPWYGELDPYAMALLSVDEALRNLVAVGADPARVALLDNFGWGNPTLPDRLGGLVRAALGCHDAAVAHRVPFISGKDSLFNEYRLADGTTHAIPGTLLISAIGIVPDIRQTMSMPLKQPGNALYLIGLTGDDLGGSLALRLDGRRGDRAPESRLPLARKIFRALHRAIRDGLVLACHDLSEGGLAVAAAEMAIGSGLGLEIDLGEVPATRPALPEATILFAESPSRFLVEVAPESAAAFEERVRTLPHARVGQVLAEPVLRVAGREGMVIEAEVARLKACWQAPLQEAMP